jgi:TRAP-type transport system periplasmic protein
MRGLPLLALIWALVPLQGEAVANSLRIGVPWSPGSKGMSDLQAAGRDIAKRTAGRVQVKFVEQHDLDSGPAPCAGALLAGPALARESPAARVFALPLLFRSSAEVAQLRGRIDATVASELDARGFATVAQLDLGFAYLHSRTRIQTVAELHEAQLWVPASPPESMRMVESYGMPLVPLETSQVREALRQGTVAAAIIPPLGAILLQWHLEFKSVVAAPFLCLYAVVVVRKDALAELEVADQAVLREELGRAFSAAAEDLRRKESESLDVLAQSGVERLPLGGAFGPTAEWEAWAATVADRLVAAGVVPAAVREQARQSLADFRATP